MGGATAMLPYVGHQMLYFTLIRYSSGLGYDRLGYVWLGYIGMADNSQQLF